MGNGAILKVPVQAALAALILFCPVLARADLYSGTLNVSGGGMTGQEYYDGVTDPPGDKVNTGFQVNWHIENMGTYFHYEYTISGDGGLNLPRDISHLLLEVSSSFTSENIWNATKSVDAPKTYAPPSPSNPGLPDSIFGVKFNTGSGVNFVLEFDSDRDAMWGDFYAKSGGDTAAWNTDFGSAVDHSISTATRAFDFNGTELLYKLGVPDTKSPPPPVPAPGAAVLVVLGAGSVGWLKRYMA